MQDKIEMLYPGGPDTIVICCLNPLDLFVKLAAIKFDKAERESPKVDFFFGLASDEGGTTERNA